MVKMSGPLPITYIKVGETKNFVKKKFSPNLSSIKELLLLFSKSHHQSSLMGETLEYF
jgi:hypothetical protein